MAFRFNKNFRHIYIKTLSPSFIINKFTQKIPSSVRGVGRIIKNLKTKDLHINKGINLIIRGIEKLAIEKDILKHINNRLIKALIEKKKRCKYNKLMSLLSFDAPGQAIFFSLAKITAIQEQQQELEVQKKTEKFTKKINKQHKVIKKNEKAQKIQQRKKEKKQLAVKKKEVKECIKKVKIFEK